MRKNIDGISLVEKMVVMMIVIILALVGIIQFSNVAEKTYRDTALVALKGIRDGISLYYTDRRGYTTSTSELAPYVNITGLISKFNTVEITVINNAYCASGTVANITPLYNVTHCVSAPLTPTSRTNLENQPTCCWNKTTVCTDNNNWYACRTRM